MIGVVPRISRKAFPASSAFLFEPDMPCRRQTSRAACSPATSGACIAK